MTPARSILILCAVIGGLAIAVATRLSFGTDITNLMPEGRAGSLADVSRRLTDSELARTMVLNVGGPDTATAVAGARALAERLAENPEVAWLRSGVDEGQLQAIYELYFPRRNYFVSFDPARIPELTSETALRAKAERAKRDLALPSAPLLEASGGLRSARELPGHPRAHLGPAALARSAWMASSSRAMAASPCSSWGRARPPSTATARRRCWRISRRPSRR